MTILLPRARLNLDAPEWQSLQLSESEKTVYQVLLDESDLEARLKEKFNKVITLSATDILPSDTVLNAASINIENVSIVILVSKHAAFLSRFLFPEKFFHLAQCFSVGSASQRFFENLNIKSASTENAASLLELDALKDIAGLKTYIMKGEQGLDTLEIRCRERGADVSVLNLYKRCQSSTIEKQLSEIDLTKLEAIYGVSVFALEHLLNGASELTKASLLQKELLAMSERIAKAASDMGFKNIVVDA